MTDAMADDLELALHLAEVADQMTMDRFGALDLLIETKPDLTPVTEADRAVEQRLRAMIAEARPQDGVLGEEFGSSGSADGRQWIIDPIDGTKNYVRGVPVWATLIALVQHDEVVVGVISAPALVRRWWAGRGLGAWGQALGKEPVRLQASGVRSLADASLSFSDAIGWGSSAAGLVALQEQTWRQRGYGDFWSHMLVAEGAVDIATEPELGPWDIAAIVPIVTEAGGRISAMDGRAPLVGGSAVTTNAYLHDEVLALLNPPSLA
jgi:histidinol-phosphatase